MQELIKQSGLKLKEFAEKYEIPYNTIRQWYNGERQAPIYIKKMIQELNNNKNQMYFKKYILQQKQKDQTDYQ